MVEAPTEHPNVTAYKRMIAAFNNNDLSAVESLVHPDMVYSIPGKSPLACNTRGVSVHLSVVRHARAQRRKLAPRAPSRRRRFLVRLAQDQRRTAR
jgi:ketosteroid isomerase-like protein